MRRKLAAAFLGSLVLLALTAEPGNAQPAATFADGVWTVGADVLPGIYVVDVPLQAQCRVILESGGTRADVTFEQWRPEASLRAGDRFATYGCGTWSRLP